VRIRAVARPNHLYSDRQHLARELTDHSLPEIGRGMGDRSHTTVLHAVNRVSASLHSDPAVRESVDKLRSRLGRRV